MDINEKEWIVAGVDINEKEWIVEGVIPPRGKTVSATSSLLSLS